MKLRDIPEKVIVVVNHYASIYLFRPGKMYYCETFLKRTNAHGDEEHTYEMVVCRTPSAGRQQ